MTINLSALRRSTARSIRHILSILALALCAHTQTASAITIHYDLTALGGDDYRYVYTVTNDGSLGASTALEGFSILFDPVLYDETSLSIVTAAPLAFDWDELILGSGLLVDAAYDAFALAGGIAEGDSITGFAVEFTWLGAGTPGAQAFEVYDPDSFALLHTGTTHTTTSVPPTTVPEPGTLALLFIAALAAVMMRRERQNTAVSASRHAYSC